MLHNICYKNVVSDMFVLFFSRTVYTRGNNFRMYLPFCKLPVRKKFFVHRIIPIWNLKPNTNVISNVSTALISRSKELNFEKYLHRHLCAR